MDDATMGAVTAPDEACEGSLIGRPLGRAEAEELARSLKAVADPTRLQLLSLIASDPAGEACVCDLADTLEFTQPTVSHHLKILVDAGLLTREKRGTWAWYTIVPERLRTVESLLA
ncbi:metalloregulator ArsR/SmtB family transcription factor [Streptomyces sp. NPDC021622]|uniref:ArsR/SmtB family transcription factor n=1 Tax=Streptomyces sp. NPDC021622 TaxID=3155013 RepID=UPI0033D8D748